MVRIKGFTITETLVAMAIFSCAILISGLITEQLYKGPTRSDYISTNEIIKQIMLCKDTKDLQELITDKEGEQINVIGTIKPFEETSIFYFEIRNESRTLFSHFIILKNES